MSAATTWPVLVILLLGIWHGLNPGMGWLFAVALGLQEQERRFVWRALLPLAAGHALAIGAAIAVGLALGMVVPAQVLKWGVAVVLVGFGASRLLRNRHPRYGGMRMSMRALTAWSFLMATAHGAGLMVLPFVLPDEPAAAAQRDRADSTVEAARPAPTDGVALPLRLPPGAVTGAAANDGGHATHLRGSAWSTGRLAGLNVLLVHTLGYLLAAGMIAVLVYEKLGLRLLRTMWINLDLVWGIALIATGALAPLV